MGQSAPSFTVDKMRSLVVFCLLLGSALAWPYFNDVAIAGPSVAQKQQTLNHLLFKLTEPLSFEDLATIAKEFDPVADSSMYKDNGEAAAHLMKELNDNRLLEQHHWFSLFNTRQREEALMLFSVLMNCKDWDCAVGNAAFFREKMNEGEYLYALVTAVIHSPLGKGLVVPPMYEITPHMFVNSEIIQQAYSAQMSREAGVFKVEWTGTQKNPEQHVAYFGEDIGMNVHHVTWHMDYPFWWDDEKSGGVHLDRKGELFFWAHHQLTARFDAERLSNHLDMVEELYWDRPIVEGFAPHTTYRYGGEFPTRPDNINFADVEGLVRVRDMIIHEQRIRDAIDLGYITAKDGSHIDITGTDGIDHLGDIIESSVYSPNRLYYGALHNEAHILLGRQSDPQGRFNLPPSVMEHFETATRDPAFFRLHKYMDNIFKEHKDTLPAYTEEDLAFPGVHLTGVDIEGEFVTYFEDFDIDLKMALDTSNVAAMTDVKAIASRLNHKDFAYNFHIKNDGGDHKHAIIRVYLCPQKTNQGVIMPVDEARWHCIEMDKFWKKLDAGENHISRTSKQSSLTVPDIPSFSELIHKADEAVKNGEEFDTCTYEKQCGIPNRMLLPKGNEEGLEFWLEVIVNDAIADNYEFMEDNIESHSHCGVRGEEYPDKRPMGFPMDRPIPDERLFMNADNIHSQLVKIFHK